MGGVEDRVVLDGRDRHGASRRVGLDRGLPRPDESEVVGLGAARGEDHLSRVRAEIRCERLAGLLQHAAGRTPEGVHRGRVAPAGRGRRRSRPRRQRAPAWWQHGRDRRSRAPILGRLRPGRAAHACSRPRPTAAVTLPRCPPPTTVGSDPMTTHPTATASATSTPQRRRRTRSTPHRSPSRRLFPPAAQAPQPPDGPTPASDRQRACWWRAGPVRFRPPVRRYRLRRRRRRLRRPTGGRSCPGWCASWISSLRLAARIAPRTAVQPLAVGCRDPRHLHAHLAPQPRLLRHRRRRRRSRLGPDIPDPRLRHHDQLGRHAQTSTRRRPARTSRSGSTGRSRVPRSSTAAT